MTQFEVHYQIIVILQTHILNQSNWGNQSTSGLKFLRRSVTKNSTDNKSTPVQGMAWHITDHKILAEPRMIK